MTLKKTTSETGTHSPVADILNTVSGAYCSEFWDGVYEVSGTLNTLRELKHSFEALYRNFRLDICRYALAASALMICSMRSPPIRNRHHD